MVAPSKVVRRLYFCLPCRVAAQARSEAAESARWYEGNRWSGISQRSRDFALIDTFFVSFDHETTCLTRNSKFGQVEAVSPSRFGHVYIGLSMIWTMRFLTKSLTDG